MSAVKPEFPVRTGRGDVADAGDLVYHDRGGGGAALGLPDELSQLLPGPRAGQTQSPPLRLRGTDNNKSYNRESENCFIVFLKSPRIARKKDDNTARIQSLKISLETYFFSFLNIF